MKYRGSCHCGEIAFEAEGEIESLLQCNCSICTKRGYLLWFVAANHFTSLTPAAKPSTYTFNKHVITHNFCSTCGCAPYSNGADAQGNLTYAINARCLDDVELDSIGIHHYDGRSI